MGDVNGGTIELDLHDRKRVERDRASALFLADQRDDCAGETLALAGEDTVGQLIRRQRLGGDDTELCDQMVQLILRQRQAGTLDDAGQMAGMGAQGQIDGRLAKSLEPERCMAAQPSSGLAQMSPASFAPSLCHSRLPVIGRFLA
jgi:hypothetical protein